MSDARYHVRFLDTNAGQILPLMLVETGGRLGYVKRTLNPYAAKTAGGERKYSDLTEWSTLAFDDWRGGRGQDRLTGETDKTKFYDSGGLETRIEGQITLGPLKQIPTGYPAHTPGSVSGYGAGYPGPTSYLGGTDETDLGTASDYQFTKLAMSFTVPSGSAFTRKAEAISVYIKKDAGATGVVRVAIYNGDEFGPSGSELVYGTVNVSSVSTSYSYVKVTLTSPYTLTAGADYWIVLTTTSTESDGLIYWARYGGIYSHGRAQYAWFGWDVYSTQAHRHKVHWQKTTLEMSFTAPAAGMTSAGAYLYLRRQGTISDFTVGLYDDSGGDPDTLLKSATITNSDVDTGYSWVKVTWASGESLSGSTVYHLVLTPPASEEGSDAYLSWGGDDSEGYTDGSPQIKWGSGSWSSLSTDLYFQTEPNSLDGDVVAFARYNDKWYCGAGDTVYEWNDTNETWDVSETLTGDDVTDLAVWDDYLWAARGSAANLRRYNGTTWADAPGPVKAQLLRTGGGYLHRSGPWATNNYKIYWTADGTNWTTIEIGSSDYNVTGMAWFNDMLIVATATGLYGTVGQIAGDDLAYPLLDWSSQEDASNGKGMTVWSRDGALYIPLLYGLYRWNGETMVPVGPEQGTGLPSDRAGKIVKLLGTPSWLFAAVDGGTSNTSSVLVYNGLGGWHEIARADNAGDRILALGFETMHSPSRLWFGLGDETRYLKLPDTSDNPWQYTGYEYNGSGELITSWIGSELIEIVKDLHEVVLRGEGIAPGQEIDVYYEVDRSDQWVLLGTVDTSPRGVLSFDASSFSTKTVGDGSTTTTIELKTGSTTGDMAVGDWVRINGEVSQVKSITDSDTFVLETALSSAPSEGDTCYPSRPAGREFRLKLNLRTDDSSKTPKITAIIVRYQNNVIDRFIHTLTVRVEDGMKDLNKQPYPYTAAELRAELDSWITRVTPFTFEDPDGNTHTVKINSATDSGYRIVKEEGQSVRYESVYVINLVEVA